MLRCHMFVIFPVRLIVRTRADWLSRLSFIPLEVITPGKGTGTIATQRNREGGITFGLSPLTPSPPLGSLYWHWCLEPKTALSDGKHNSLLPLPVSCPFSSSHHFRAGLMLTLMLYVSCVVVKSLTEAFQRADTDRDGWVQMSYEHFMQMVLEVSLCSKRITFLRHRCFCLSQAHHYALCPSQKKAPWIPHVRDRWTEVETWLTVGARWLGISRFLDVHTKEDPQSLHPLENKMKHF